MLNLIKDIIRYIRVIFIIIKSNVRKNLPTLNNILIIAPHPDDETLGCGGLISHLCSEKKYPHVIIMTGGGSSFKGQDSCENHLRITQNKIIRARRKLTLDSAKNLGLRDDNIHFLDFKDGYISDRSEKEMSQLKKLIEEINPSSIFVPHWGEGWPDHIATREIILSIFSQRSAIPSIYEYCVWMWYYNVWNHDWKNAFKFRMSKEEHKAKLRAIDAYIKPLAPNGKPWSGVLPKAFIYANTLKTELYFEICSK